MDAVFCQARSSSCICCPSSRKKKQLFKWLEFSPPHPLQKQTDKKKKQTSVLECMRKMDERRLGSTDILGLLRDEVGTMLLKLAVSVAHLV